MEPATLLVEHAAELVTVAGPVGPRRGPAQAELGIVRDGAVAAGRDGTILAVGTTADVRSAVELSPGARVIIPLADAETVVAAESLLPSKYRRRHD